MTLSLSTQARTETGKKVKDLRKQGKIPAVLYGHGLKNLNLSVPYNPFEKIYQQAGESSLVDLAVDNKKPVKVLIQAVQTDPVSDRFVHIDFYQVKMTEKITAEIKLKFIGEAPAVKELSGVLVTNLNYLKVRCFPQDLVHEIEVEVSSLKTFDDVIYIKDLKIPSKIEILEKTDEVVVTVIPPRSEEELKELEAKPAEVKEAEVIIKEKKAEGEVGGEAKAESPKMETEKKVGEKKRY